MSESKYLEQLMSYFLALVRERLVLTYGIPKGAQYTAEFEDAFHRIFSENEYMMPDDLAKRHGMNPSFVLALREVLQQVDISFDDLKEHVLAVYRSMMHQLVQGYKAQVVGSADSWKTVVEYTKVGNQNNYDNDYFNLEYVVESENELGFDIKKCMYFEIFAANDHPELGPILCEYDYILMDAISEWIRFERTKTIADGNDRCDFRLYRK